MQEKLKIKIKKLSPKGTLPRYSKVGDAGLDLVATSIDLVNQGTQIEVGTDISLEIPEGFVGLIFPRSSICKYDLQLTNSVGVIDSGYRGEIKFKFALLESPQSAVIYNVGDKIGQLLILPYPQIEFEEVEELSTTIRGESGFGSSGN